MVTKVTTVATLGRSSIKSAPVANPLPRTPKAVATQTKPASRPALRKAAVKTGSKPIPYRAGPFVVAIDAGHGGKDTGAIGPHGFMEKHVVYSIASKLKGFIDANPNMRAILVRKRDEFLELRERTEIAREAKADLFVSLHADAFENGEAKGSSVFTLSRSGASSEAARWLSNSENAADLVGGVKLKGRGKLLASVLLDLSQNAAIESSERAAASILRELKKSHRLHQDQVQKAGFAVLKSPDVPSLLIETAFISNAEEEKNLTNPQYQIAIARSVFNGIRAYARGAPASPAPVGARIVTASASEPSVRFIAQH